MSVPDSEAQWLADPLPWHASMMLRLQAMSRLEKLPHALLISGSSGLGKARLAATFSMGLLCRATPPEACGQCDACKWVQGNAHGDLRWVAPEEGKRAIGVETIREAVGFMQKTPAYGSYKILVIDPAEAMTLAAANALLKTLEEPPGQALLMLLSDQPGTLLPTVRSRCQTLVMHRPSADSALRWVAAQAGCSLDSAEEALWLVDGRPLAAMDLLKAGGMEDQVALVRLFRQLMAKQIGAAEAKTRLLQFDLDMLLEMALRCWDQKLLAGGGVASDRLGFHRRDRLLSLWAAHRRGINFGRDSLVSELSGLMLGGELERV